MPLPTPLQTLEDQEWTEQVGEVLDKPVAAVLDRSEPAAVKTRNFLHGTWLGHPLHPVLTDVPVGAWTTAVTLDMVDAARGKEELSAGADAAVTLGLVAAVGTAITGLADWHHTSGEARKVGILHAAFNGGATLLFAASLALRKRGHRNAGRGTGLLGFTALMAGAYLGGHLVYEHNIGTNHAAEYSGPDDFTPVLAEAELPEGELRKVEANGTPVLLVRQEGRIHALVEKCAHLGGPLSEGELKPDGSVVCPWHGSRFCLADGHVEEGPSAFKQPTLETRVREGQIEVRAA